MREVPFGTIKSVHAKIHWGLQIKSFTVDFQFLWYQTVFEQKLYTIKLQIMGDDLLCYKYEKLTRWKAKNSAKNDQNYWNLISNHLN